MNKRIVFTGIGGQGIVLLTRLIGEVLTEKGFKVISTETHGMATRGGSVISFMKIGNFKSPLLLSKEADIAVVLHPDEFERALFYLKKDGKIIGYKVPNKLVETLDINYIMKEKQIPFKSANMVAAGVLFKMLNIDIEDAIAILKRNKKATNENVAALKAGYIWEERHVSATS